MREVRTQVIEDTEFLMEYVTQLLQKFPILENHKETVLNIMIAGTGQVYQTRFDVGKPELTDLWENLKSLLPMNQALRLRSYRLQLLDLLGKSDKQFKKEYARYCESKETTYAHTEVEKPTKLEVMNLVKQQDKCVLDKLIELLPHCSDADFEFIDSYRRARQA